MMVRNSRRHGTEKHRITCNQVFSNGSVDRMSLIIKSFPRHVPTRCPCAPADAEQERVDPADDDAPSMCTTNWRRTSPSTDKGSDSTFCPTAATRVFSTPPGRPSWRRLPRVEHGSAASSLSRQAVVRPKMPHYVVCFLRWPALWFSLCAGVLAGYEFRRARAVQLLVGLCDHPAATHFTLRAGDAAYEFTFQVLPLLHVLFNFLPWRSLSGG